MRLMSQLLQTLQFVYLQDPSALCSAARYLIAALPDLVAARRGQVRGTVPAGRALGAGLAGAPGGSGFTGLMARFWVGLQEAVHPSVPHCVGMTKEHLTLPGSGGSHPLDQVWSESVTW